MSLWWVPRPSKPLSGSNVVGGFDSHTFPQNTFKVHTYLMYKINTYIIYLFMSIVYSAFDYNLELIHNVRVDEFNSNSNFGVSDVWGYTDETGIEYAIIGYRYGTFIYDVSSSIFPILISDIVGPSGSDYYYHRDYKTYGDYLYIVNEMTGNDVGMQVIDLSPLPNGSPIQLDTYDNVNQSHNLWIDEASGYAFIEHYYGDNIHIADLTNPSDPSYGGTFGYLGDSCHDIFTRDNVAYISEGYNSSYGIYDITNLNNISQLATISVVGYAHNAWLNDLGTHLITTEETVGIPVKIWDISNLDNINLVSQYLGENDLAHNVHVKNDQLIISHYTTGVKIVDIFDPARPVEVAAFDTYPDNDNSGFYGCWGVYPFAGNNYIYASDMQYGLFIFDYDWIETGWVSGYVYDINGNAITGFLRSVLNEKTFSVVNGYYEIGFAEGDQVFEVVSNGQVLGEVIIPILPHQDSITNLYVGLNESDFGDINQDQMINILDIIIVINIILESINPLDIELVLSDVNNDLQINVLDIIAIVNIILDTI